MNETIYTIPINEAFDEVNGCPFCRLTAKLENDAVEYVMGAAMMEPDVRIETNKQGFCKKHFADMLAKNNKLSLALILESHLAQVHSSFDVPSGGGKKMFGKKAESDAGAVLEELEGSCYVCKRMSFFEEKYFSNAVSMWKTDAAFREKLAKQPFFCVEHSGKLLSAAKEELKDKYYGDFYSAVLDIQKRYIEKISEDVSGFCKSFDHQNAGIPLTEDQRRAVANAIEFLR